MQVIVINNSHRSLQKLDHRIHNAAASLKTKQQATQAIVFFIKIIYVSGS